jgi:hypothetical protein
MCLRNIIQSSYFYSSWARIIIFACEFVFIVRECLFSVFTRGFWGRHSRGYEEVCLLRHKAVQCSKVSCSSSRWCLTWLILRPRSWRQNVCLKCLLTFHETTRSYVTEDGSARPTFLLMKASSQLTMYKFGGNS